MARPRPARLGGWPCGWITEYLSDHFTNQIWGIQPSYAFVAEPQTKAVQSSEGIIHGRIYRNIAELRDAVRDFVESMPSGFEKNGYLSPARSSGVARRDLNQARRVRSKEPGALHKVGGPFFKPLAMAPSMAPAPFLQIKITVVTFLSRR